MLNSHSEDMNKNLPAVGQDLLLNPTLSNTFTGNFGFGPQQPDAKDSDDDSDDSPSAKKKAKKNPALSAAPVPPTSAKTAAGLLAETLADADSDDEIAIKVSGTTSGGAAASSSSRAAPATAPPTKESQTADRLFQLKLKMNQGRQENTKAVLEEKKKHEEGSFSYYKKRAEWKEKADKQKKLEDLEDQVDQGLLPEAALNASTRAAVPKGKEYLVESAEIGDARLGKKRKRMDAEEHTAYEIFNQDAFYRAHEKRTDQIKFSKQDYEKQKSKLGEEAFYNDGQHLIDHQTTAEGKQKFLDAMKKQEEKKASFSRRRLHVDEKDFQHINERNAHFNKKMDRHYADHTLEIRQNLERGTAL